MEYPQETPSDILKCLYHFRDRDPVYYNKLKKGGITISIQKLSRPQIVTSILGVKQDYYTFMVLTPMGMVMQGSLDVEPSQLEGFCQQVNRELEREGFKKLE